MLEEMAKVGVNYGGWLLIAGFWIVFLTLARFWQTSNPDWKLAGVNLGLVLVLIAGVAPFLTPENVTWRQKVALAIAIICLLGTNTFLRATLSKMRHEANKGVMLFFIYVAKTFADKGKTVFDSESTVPEEKDFADMQRKFFQYRGLARPSDIWCVTRYEGEGAVAGDFLLRVAKDWKPEAEFPVEVKAYLIHLDIPETEAKEDEEIRIGFMIRRFFPPEPMTGHIRRSAKTSGSRKYYWTLRE